MTVENWLVAGLNIPTFVATYGTKTTRPSGKRTPPLYAKLPLGFVVPVTVLKEFVDVAFDQNGGTPADTAIVRVVLVIHCKMVAALDVDGVR